MLRHPQGNSGRDADMRANAEFWDRIARKYAADPIADQAGYDRTIARVRDLLGPRDRVVELGCGTGSTALKLADGTGSYLATDFSAGMIAIAEERLAAAPVDQLHFRLATAGDLIGHEAPFDAALGFNYLHLVDDLPGTLDAIGGMLVPGGLFVSKTPCLGDMNPLIRLAIPLMQLIGKAPHVIVLSATALQAAIRAAGFEIVACEYHGSGRRDARPVIVARKRR